MVALRFEGLMNTIEIITGLLKDQKASESFQFYINKLPASENS